MSMRSAALAATTFASLMAFAAPHAASAQLAITSQDRSVVAESESRGELWDESQTPFFPDYEFPIESFTATAQDDEVASDSEPFDAVASTIDPPVQGLAPQGTASSTQTSSLAESVLAASGSFSTQAHSRTLTQAELDLANLFLAPLVPFNLGILSSYESAGSHYEVGFDLVTALPYTISATADLSATERLVEVFGWEQTSGVVSVELVGPSGVVTAMTVDQHVFCGFDGPCLPASGALDESGTLPPGHYTLTASIVGSAFGTCTEVPGMTPFECHTPAADGSFDVVLSFSAPSVPSSTRATSVLLVTLLLALGIASTRVPSRCTVA